MKFIIIFICIITTTVGYTIEKPDIKNLILTKNLKTYEEVIFKDKNQKDVDLHNYKGKLIILNFWATWCLPCKEEMPSLDNLQKNISLNNLKIFPINISQESLPKAESFFKELNIKNLDIYFDAPITLAKKFSLRGFQRVFYLIKKQRICKIIGPIDFNDKDLLIG